MQYSSYVSDAGADLWWSEWETSLFSSSWICLSSHPHRLTHCRPLYTTADFTAVVKPVSPGSPASYQCPAETSNLQKVAFSGTDELNFEASCLLIDLNFLSANWENRNIDFSNNLLFRTKKIVIIVRSPYSFYTWETMFAWSWIKDERFPDKTRHPAASLGRLKTL